MKADICSIIFNEELLLPMWIESWLKVPFVNKIYLVDGGSTDKSIEIAKSYDRVTVLVVPWKNDFSRQRNIAIKLAKSEWIMQPDIDEIPCRNLDDKRLNDSLNRQDINQILLPYVKFYNWNRLWFFNNGSTPCLHNSDLVKFGTKSTITLFRRGHLGGYAKSLHEMPLFNGSEKCFQLSFSVKLETLGNGFLIGHYDQAKHFEQAKRNGTSVEFEMGLKRLRYRLISPAVHQCKTYDAEWAKNALTKLRDGDILMIEELGKMQLNSFMGEHEIFDFDVSDINNEIVNRKR